MAEMKRYNVPLLGVANLCVTVETEETDPAKIAELAQEQVNASLCHQCGGEGNDSLTLGDEWEVSVDTQTGKPEVYEVS
jgi:hypothetical protein